MERLPDLVHWKRWRSTENWRVSRKPQTYLYQFLFQVEINFVYFIILCQCLSDKRPVKN